MQISVLVRHLAYAVAALPRVYGADDGVDYRADLFVVQHEFDAGRPREVRKAFLVARRRHLDLLA
ncbi:MAG: hypothetical protein ACT443_04015, partial [Gemmatimonadota bacterium]